MIAILYLFLLHMPLCSTNTLLTPTELNNLRFSSPDAALQGHFKAFLSPISPFVENKGCPSTPGDVKGPFHLPPENVPTGFPEREEACVPDPVCLSCQGHHGYDGGIPLILTGEVFSAANCQKLSGDGVLADLWQADPSGAYWKAEDIWERRRRVRSNNSTHKYNCRAHSEIKDEHGGYQFRTYLPGHYIAGSAWRPRHLHIRLQAPGFQTLVTQIYFHGDRFLGEGDTACGFCKSDHPALLVLPKLLPENGTFSLCNLPQHSGAMSGIACPTSTIAASTLPSTVPSTQTSTLSSTSVTEPKTSKTTTKSSFSTLTTITSSSSSFRTSTAITSQDSSTQPITTTTNTDTIHSTSTRMDTTKTTTRTTTTRATTANMVSSNTVTSISTTTTYSTVTTQPPQSSAEKSTTSTSVSESASAAQDASKKGDSDESIIITIVIVVVIIVLLFTIIIVYIQTKGKKQNGFNAHETYEFHGDHPIIHPEEAHDSSRVDDIGHEIPLESHI
eukprot:m.8976 g.8976  ORF g.8976 m.8976 type:complete len:503 (-) comp3985_c0_seq1:74-1582(-)